MCRKSLYFLLWICDLIFSFRKRVTSLMANFLTLDCFRLMSIDNKTCENVLFTISWSLEKHWMLLWHENCYPKSLYFWYLAAFDRCKKWLRRKKFTPILENLFFVKRLLVSRKLTLTTNLWWHNGEYICFY